MARKSWFSSRNKYRSNRKSKPNHHQTNLNMAKHRHADLMLAYAQDAQESDAPWLLWEYIYMYNDGWQPCKDNPSWSHKLEYRRKVKTIRIGEYDVPEPLRVRPNVGETYHFVSFKRDSNVHSYSWQGDSIDDEILSKGIIHLTHEAAELHAKALISLTKL